MKFFIIRISKRWNKSENFEWRFHDKNEYQMLSETLQSL